ncbi:hypothetical protein [Cupriavidus taiwanensis]|nr:hypothetical protein [Cupriavidus taiwanensis]
MMDVSKLRLLSDDALRTLNHAVVGVIRERQAAKQREVAISLRIGGIASFYSRKDGKTVKIRIDRLNMKTVSGTEVDPTTHKPTFRTWRVSPSLLTAEHARSDKPLSGAATF